MDIPRIPGFEILEALPRGGMSVVYKARQLSLNRLVALKTLPGDLIRGTADIEQFLAEARLTANLKHPNIVQVYDFGKSEDGVYYFAMHYVTGYTVDSWIRRKGFLSETDTLLVAQTIAEALDYAWQKAGVIHCDIKPANVIVDGDGTVKVADLGLAQSIDHLVDRKLAEKDEVAGTPEYMAPEQVCGKYPLDCRVDIYALGAMMYHCLTGKTPFHGRPSTDIMVLQETGFIQDPQDIRPELSIAISCLVETFMAKDRRFRHAGWVEAQQDIKRALNGQNPERILPLDGISTVTRSPVRARHMMEMENMPPDSLEITQAATPVYNLFSPNDRTTTRKTARKQILPANAKRVFAGFLGVAILVLTGLVLKNMLTSKSFYVGNLPITASADRSSVPKAAIIPLPTLSLPSLRGGGERNPREMLETAVEWARTNNTCYDEIINKLKQVAERTRGTPQAIMTAKELGQWVGRKQQAVDAEMESNRWAEADRFLRILMNDTAGSILQGELDTAENRIRDAWQDAALTSHQPCLSRLADQLSRIRHADEWIIRSFEPQVGREIVVQFQNTSERLLIRAVTANRVVAEQNAKKNKGRIVVQRSFKASELSLEERVARVGADAALLRGWLLWQAGDWTGAEKQWGKSDAGLSKSLLDAGREQHKSSPPWLPPAKSETDITYLQKMLLERNPKLAPEQIAVRILDGKVVRLEIVSLYARDIRPVSGLTELRSLVCVAFEPDENNDSAKSAPIEDLTPLKGLRLRELNLFGTRVKDLTPLKGMPLEALDIANTDVKDITPLMNLPLKSLNIKQTAVRDITPIVNSPIERIWLDFNPLKRPRETDRKFRAVLRRMPLLKFINDRTVAEFKERQGQ